MATLWYWLLTFLCPGSGPIVGQTTAAIATAVSTAPTKGRSVFMLRPLVAMLKLAHLLQASQAKIPIQFVDEIPHDRIPFGPMMGR